MLVTHGDCSDIVNQMKPHFLHVWGHAHNSYGVYKRGDICKGHVVTAPISICCPIMDYLYRPHSLPIVVDISKNRVKEANIEYQDKIIKKEVNNSRSTRHSSNRSTHPDEAGYSNDSSLSSIGIGTGNGIGSDYDYRDITKKESNSLFRSLFDSVSSGWSTVKVKYKPQGNDGDAKSSARSNSSQVVPILSK